MGKRIQFVFLVVKTFISRHIKFLALGFLGGFFFILFLLQVYPIYVQTAGQKEQIIGMVGRYDESNLPVSIRNKISLGLTALTASGSATSSLAQSWKVENNGKDYIFSLPHNVYWQDGTQFSSSDVNYHLSDVRFIPIDKYLLKVSLKEPYTPLPILLSEPLFKPNLVGLGVYKVARIEYNGDYITSLSLVPIKGGLPDITYKFYLSTDDAILAFKIGEVNTLENLGRIDDLANWKNVKITPETEFNKFVGIFLNLNNSFFKEKDIRQALYYATPNFDDFEKVYTPISPLSWAYSQKVRLYKFDPATAQKILAKSPLGSSSAQLTISTFVNLLDTAQTVSDTWNNIGLHTKVKVQSSIPSDYQVFILTFGIPPDPDQYQFWQSTQDASNISHYSSLKVDKLLEDGRRTLNMDDRKKIYADFQRYLVEDAPVIFLYHPKIYIVERK